MFELSDLMKAAGARLIRKGSCDKFNGVSTDSRTINKGEIFIALIGATFDGHDYINDVIKKGASAVIVSKMIKTSKDFNILFVRDTSKALMDLARFYRNQYSIPMVAVTGSTGKTTTKDMIRDVLSVDYSVFKNPGTQNNYIGLSSALLKISDKHNACVLELGTNHFGEIACLGKIARPQVSVITNIGPSHLEFLKDLDGVLREKKSIADYLVGPKILLLNGDDSLLRKLKLSNDVKVFYYGMKNNCDFMAKDISIANNKVCFKVNGHKFCLNSLGRFNVYNALSAIACGIIFGVDMLKINKAIKDFKFPKQRLNMIVCKKFSIIDDTYNSNPLSFRAALDTLLAFKPKGRKIVVMGDMLELGEGSLELHKNIGSLISKKPVDIFVTLGKLSMVAANEARSQSNRHKGIFSFENKESLVDFLKEEVKIGDVLLIKGSRLLKMEEIVNQLVKNAL